MPVNVTAQLADSHRLLAEIGAPRMAKADLRKAEIDPKVLIGRAIDRTRVLSGLSLKEFAAALDKDERQVARWMAGVERPQIDAIFAVVVLRGYLVIALAELAQDVEVTTTVTIKRVG